jgi:L-fuconolactonase
MTFQNDSHTHVINRRQLLCGVVSAGALGIAAKLAAQPGAPPIIDCHIHLFDQTRPQGAPYSGGRGNTAPALPARYRALASPLGIVGAIEIDASPWIEDNLWVLETIEKDPIIVGTAGNLEPGKPEFREYIERFHKNKLFLGYRYGNVWGRNFVAEIEKPEFAEGLKITSEMNLVLDSGNPRADLIAALLKAKDKVPRLRIVLDHTGNLAPRVRPGGRGALSPDERASMEKNLRELASRPGVYFKISEYLQVNPDGSAITDPAEYKPVFDYLLDVLGEDRVVFGSDWPNGNALNNIGPIVRIAREYFSHLPVATQEKFYWRNSISAYSWIRRESSQPSA